MPATRSLPAALLAIFAALAVALALAPPVDASPRGQAVGPSATGRYIVVVDDGVNPSAVARDHGLAPAHVYRHALRGFAAGMSPRNAENLQRDGRVLHVEGETVERVQAQTLPTGIDRIETDRNPNVTTDGTGTSSVPLPIAIIDTGINTHADLNVAGGRNFANGGADNWGDGNGHGTHVAGTVAATDNGVGVVGVAPGAPVWSVRVCGNSGFCMSGDIVAGINWVAQQKSGVIDFAAANFSISSADSDSSCESPANATHDAICGLVDTGVVFAMAAGNDGRLKVPYPVAFSVSAIADFDGQAGGTGSPTCRQDADDTLASFSNYGSGVDIAAPGVCILSTWNDGGYRSISGTSMATPHVTGAVALYLHANGSAPATDASGVAVIEDAIVGAAHRQGATNHECSYDDSRIGGPLLFVNATAFGGDGSCGVAGGTTDPDPDPAPPTADFTYSCDGLTCQFTDESEGEIDSRTWEFGDGSTSTDVEPSHTYASAGEYTVTLTVENDDGSDSSSQQITVTEPVEGGIDLAVSTYKSRGFNTADLTWSRAATTSVVIHRDGSPLATVPNSGSYTDNVGTRGGATHRYQVCETGTTPDCSPEVTATW